MARRSDHSREELKELIIKSGHDIIRLHGFSRFSARSIARDIGYTVGTVYNIFGTHDDLILSINARTLDHWYYEIKRLLSKHKKPSVDVLARHYIDYSRKHYNEWIALFEHRMSDGGKVPEWYMQKMSRFFELLENLVMPYAGGRKKAEEIARVLWAGIHGICILSLSNKLELVGSQSAEKLAVSFIKNYMRGLENG